MSLYKMYEVYFEIIICYENVHILVNILIELLVQIHNNSGRRGDRVSVVAQATIKFPTLKQIA